MPYEGGGHIECQPSTLHPARLEGNTGCLVMFGRSFGSRYTMFIKAGDHLNHHDRAFAFMRFCIFHSGHLHRPTHLDSNFFKDLLLIMRLTPQTPFALYRTSTIVEDLSILHVEDPPPAFAEEVQRLKESNFDYATKDSSNGSLVKHSLLSITDDF